MNLTDDILYFNNSIKYQYQYLTQNIETEILIVGGGITGAITAYYYCMQGYKVMLIEKNIIGNGSTRATTAIMEYQIDKDLNILKNEIGLKNAVKCFKMCSQAIDEIKKIVTYINQPNINFQKQDSYYYANKKNQLLKEFLIRKDFFPVELKTKDQYLNFKYSINLKNASAIMNPYTFTTELINKLNQLENFTVYENTKLIDLTSTHAITNNKFKIKFQKCILTTGFEATNIIKSTTKLYKTFAIVTEKLNINANFTARDIKNPYHYIRFSKGRIIYGGEDILLKDYNNNSSKKAYNKLHQSFKKDFPKFKNCKIEYKFNGTFANTEDTLPIIDKLKKNVYCNLGYGANGILYSVIGAKSLVNNKLNKLFKIR